MQITGPDRELGGVTLLHGFPSRNPERVHYEVDGTEYELQLPARLVYCPSRLPQRTCQRAADRMFPNG